MQQIDKIQIHDRQRKYDKWIFKKKILTKGLQSEYRSLKKSYKVDINISLYFRTILFFFILFSYDSLSLDLLKY